MAVIPQSVPRRSPLVAGTRFGRYTVIEDVGVFKRGKGTCRVLCDCGNERLIGRYELLSGKTVSCGCKRRTANGMSAIPEYMVWSGIIKRCTNKRSTEHWAYYGGRGITICEVWATSFERFFRDMGPRPSKQHSIERRDNDGPYSPDNCYWATRAEQGRNRRNNVLISHNGETLILAEWARRIGISPSTLRDRLSNGWKHDEAVSTPKLKSKSGHIAAKDCSFDRPHCS